MGLLDDAQSLLEDARFKNVMTATRHGLFTRIEKSKPEESDVREEAYQSLRTLTEMTSVMAHAIRESEQEAARQAAANEPQRLYDSERLQ